MAIEEAAKNYIDQLLKEVRLNVDNREEKVQLTNEKLNKIKSRGETVVLNSLVKNMRKFKDYEINTEDQTNYILIYGSAP